MQEESAQLEQRLSSERERSMMLQQDLGASLRDSKEALHREVDIMAQLEAQDEVCRPPQSSALHASSQLSTTLCQRAPAWEACASCRNSAAVAVWL